jgi:hypothetical protein
MEDETKHDEAEIAAEPEIEVAPEAEPEQEPNEELAKAQKEAAYWRRQAEKAKKVLPADDDVKADVKFLKLAEKKRQFQFEHGLTPDQTDMIFKINPNPSKKDLENPFIQGGLTALKAKARVEDNTPSSSGRSFSIAGKSWAEMSSDERKANNEAYNKYLLEKRQR